MIDGEALMRPADANPAAVRTVEKNGLGAESNHVHKRYPSNWAWSTVHNQYDWMDSHSFSCDYSQL
jgi:hypothetical protein